MRYDQNLAKKCGKIFQIEDGIAEIDFNPERLRAKIKPKSASTVLD